MLKKIYLTAFGEKSIALIQLCPLAVRQHMSVKELKKQFMFKFCREM